MAPTAWDDGIVTGVESIDTEHRLQVSLVNALEEVVRGGTEPALASRTIAQLVDFTHVHFQAEELMMRLYAYPQLEAHRAEHVRLSEQVDALRQRLATGADGGALEAIGELHRWLTEHIRGTDQAFARWCGRHGIQAR